MKIAAVTMVRDEGDIIGPVLAHMLDEGVDQLFVVDDGSTDDTPDILAEFVKGAGIVVHRRDDPVWPQAQVMNDLCKEAAAAGANWVVPFDADEFWLAPGSTFTDVISAAEAKGARKIYAQVLHHLDWDRRFKTSHLPKVAFRYQANAHLAIGNHDVNLSGLADGFVIRHVPYRSLEQFTRKTRAAIARHPRDVLERMGGWYWEHRDGLDDEAAKKEWDRYCSPEVVTDPIPYTKPEGLFSQTTAIIVPLMRAHKIGALVDNIHETTPEGQFHVYILATGECYEAAAKEAENRPGTVTAIDDGGGTWPERINRGYVLTSEPYLFTGQDDIFFHRGWLTEALSAMDGIPTGKHDGVVVVNDLWNPGGTMALVARHYVQCLSGCVDTPNTLIYPGYHHNFSDNELFDTAGMRGRLIRCQFSRVEHLHPIAGKAKRDDVYDLGASSESADSETFYSRQQLWLKGERKVPLVPNWTGPRPTDWPFARERMFNAGGQLVYRAGQRMDPARMGLLTQSELHRLQRGQQ